MNNTEIKEMDYQLLYDYLSENVITPFYNKRLDTLNSLRFQGRKANTLKLAFSGKF
jgi:uncharacterized protein (DUF2164 family)